LLQCVVFTCWRFRHLFHIQVTRDVVFFIVSHQHFPQELAYRCVDDLKGLFFQKYNLAVINNMPERGLNNDFSDAAQSKMEYHSNPTTVKLNKVQAQVAEVKDIMFEQVHTNLVARQERLDNLDIATDELRMLSQGMKTTSSKVRWNRCKRLLKMKIAMICCAVLVVILVLLYIINGTIGCGWLFDGCGS